MTLSSRNDQVRAVLILCIVAVWVAVGSAQERTTQSAQTAEQPSWKELAQEQAQAHEQTLRAQADLSRLAFDAMQRAFFTFQVLIGSGAFVLSLAGALYGVWMARSLQRFDKVRLEAEKLLAKVDERAGAAERAQAQVDQLAAQVLSCQREVDRFNASMAILGKTEELREQVDDLVFRSELMRVRLDISSEDSNDRLRAAQRASEMARQGRGALAVPVLLDCVKAHQMPSFVIEEALYGLSARGADWCGDRDAIGVVVSASRSPEKAVRLQAVRALGVLNPLPAAVQTRLTECAVSDDDREVKSTAALCLRERSITAAEGGDGGQQ